MTAQFKTFISSESGAVTVDWVVLTAAIVGLGMAVMAVVGAGVENLSDDIAQALANEVPNDNTVFAGNTDIAGTGDIAAP